jgi:hypothetical protein
VPPYVDETCSSPGRRKVTLVDTDADADWLDNLNDKLRTVLDMLSGAAVDARAVAELAVAELDPATGEYIIEAIRRARHELTGAAGSALFIELKLPKGHPETGEPQL